MSLILREHFTQLGVLMTVSKHRTATATFHSSFWATTTLFITTGFLCHVGFCSQVMLKYATFSCQNVQIHLDKAVGKQSYQTAVYRGKPNTLVRFLLDVTTAPDKWLHSELAGTKSPCQFNHCPLVLVISHLPTKLSGKIAFNGFWIGSIGFGFWGLLWGRNFFCCFTKAKGLTSPASFRNNA